MHMECPYKVKIKTCSQKHNVTDSSALLWFPIDVFNKGTIAILEISLGYTHRLDPVPESKSFSVGGFGARTSTGR